MNATRGTRLHIGFFGKRNAGKSTLMNKIIGQDISIVSDTKGTTTDTVQKTMELLPIGPVVLIDTAGIDDTGNLGEKRIEKTLKALDLTDVAVFVSDFEKLTDTEKDFIKKARMGRILISVINIKNEKTADSEDLAFLKENSNLVFETNALSKDDFTLEFKNELAKILPEEYVNKGCLITDIITENDTCVLVIPIDKEAPKGRIILPQVNTLRELLDNNTTSIVCTDEGLEKALCELKNPPKIVITDSQAFKKVSEIVPEDIMLTSFSILFARLKGDLKTLYDGAKKADELQDGDKILILESCTHHPVEDDIGRVKIPNLLKKYTGKNLVFEHYSGHDMPSDLEKYALIIHCGGCMTTRREILNRINTAKSKNTAITNYGIIIAKCTNILERAIKPFEAI